MVNKKSSLICISLLLLVFILSGCTQQMGVKEKLTGEEGGHLTVQVTLPGGSLSNSLQSVASHISIDSVEAIVTNLETAEQQNQVVNVTSGEATLSFTGLTPGQYEVEVFARETVDGTTYDLFHGGPKTTVVAIDSVTTVKLDMELLPGDLSVTATNNSSLAVETIDLSLYNSTLGSLPGQTITLDGSGTGVLFENVPATNWQLKAVLRDANGAELTSWEDDILILPGRENLVSLTINDGSITINTSWPELPGTPELYYINQNNEGLFLKWDESYHADTYAVYRSDSQYGTKTLVADNIIGSSYTDTAVGPGVYWYWVKAFNRDGLGGDFSRGEKVEVSDIALFTDPVDKFIQAIVDPVNNGSLLLEATTMTSDGSGQFEVWYSNGVEEAYYDTDSFFNGNENLAGFFASMGASSVEGVTYNNYNLNASDSYAWLDITLTISYTDLNGQAINEDIYASFNYNKINGIWYIDSIDFY